MDTFEIRDDEIDVEDIMRQIRENIKKRKYVETYSEEEINKPVGLSCVADVSSNDKQWDLEYFNESGDIQNNNYLISSHRPLIGWFLVKGRELINGEVRRYIDPIIFKQTEFNISMIQIVNNIICRLSDIDHKFEDIDNSSEQMRLELKKELDLEIGQIQSDFKESLSDIDHKFEDIDNSSEQMRLELKKELDLEIGQIQSDFKESLSDIDHKFEDIDNSSEQMRLELKKELDLEIGQIQSDFKESLSDIDHKFEDIDNSSEQMRLELKKELDLEIGQIQSDFKESLSDINHKFEDMDCSSEQMEIELNKELDLKIGQIQSDFKESLSDIDHKFEDMDYRSTESSKWSELYSQEITEQDLNNNINHHADFINLIQKYAQQSAKDFPPKIIEVGLGNGTMSIYFSRNDNYTVYGIDNNIQVINNSINNNKKLGGHAKFMLIDAFNLDIFRDKFFDVSFSQGTLEHFDNESIIQLISKQLTIAKYVIFSVPSVNWPSREFGNERKMSIEAWKGLLSNEEFNVISLEYYNKDLHIVGVITN
ncbi:MAG: methyltransferase domain-containing protein [Methanosarcinales archaeon]|nr:methyltransferase domain-containing protein [Methanosarcinales archaeon]